MSSSENLHSLLVECFETYHLMKSLNQSDWFIRLENLNKSLSLFFL